MMKYRLGFEVHETRNRMQERCGAAVAAPAAVGEHDVAEGEGGKQLIGEVVRVGRRRGRGRGQIQQLVSGGGGGGRIGGGRGSSRRGWRRGRLNKSLARVLDR
jgi:hypothetical protein